MHTVTSRQFNQDIGGAKAQAADGPVVITDRGRPSFVLLSIDEYQEITASKTSIVDLLSMPKNDISFEPSPLKKQVFNKADLD